MLETFRRIAAKAFISLLFCVLILSFALWGIPNYTRDGTNRTLAKIGDAQISEEDYRRFFDLNLNILSQQTGQRLSRENARMAYRIQQMQYGNFGADLDREILNLQIGQVVLENKAQKLGLALSDATIAEAIRIDPDYQGPDKKFNRQLFDERIRQAGFSEATYIQDRRSAEIRAQLMEPLTVALAPSKILLSIAHKFQEEKRVVTYFVLDPAKQPKVDEPDEAKLKEHYEQNKRQFMAVETRNLALLLLSQDEIKARSKVEDAEVKSTWEKDQTSWNIPERRRIQQIAFKSRDAAAAVAKEIAGGKSFLMAALEENGAQGRLDQGLLPRAGIGDPKVAAAAFSLPMNQISEPIEGRGGVLLIRVSEIQPGKTRTFDEVAKEVRDELELRRQAETAKRMHEQVEDLRGGGKTLRQIADEQKLKLVEFADVNRAGQGPDGKPALVDIADAARILASAFEGGKEVPREPLDLSDGSVAWIDVTAVKPERQKSFEDVKADVKAIWLETEARKALTASAQAIVDKIKGGESFEAAAKAQGAKLETSLPFKRQGAVPGLSGTAVRQAFTLPKGGLTATETPEGKSRMVIVVSDIQVAGEPTKEETERLHRAMSAQYQSDARTLFIGALRIQSGVTVDEALYKRLTGTDDRQR